MTDADATTDAAVPPPERRPRRRLERARDGRMLAGVAEGLGRYFEVDPVIFRIGFVVGAIAGGAGVLAYVVAVLVLPEEGSRRAPIHLGRYTPLVPWVLGGLGLLALFDGFDHDGGFPFGWSVFVLALVAWFVWAHERRGDRPAAGALATPPSQSAPSTASGTEAPLLSDDLDAVAPAPVAPRERSILGRVTVSLLLLGGGIGLAVAQASDEVTGRDVEAWFGGGLVLVGLALVVGAWWGRARPLIAMGVILTIGAATASVLDVPLRGGIGERRWTPLVASEVRPEYRLGVGDAVLDLTELGDVDDLSTDVSLTIGKLRVIVPRDATVDVDAHTALGELVVFDRQSDGTDLDESFVSRGSELGPRIDLDVRLGVGELEVLRDPS